MRKYNGRSQILGAGFLASHLRERSSSRARRDLCRQLLTGTKRNVEHLLDHPHFELVRHDVTFPLYVEVNEI